MADPADTLQIFARSGLPAFNRRMSEHAQVVKFCPHAFWGIIVLRRLTQLSLRLAALQASIFLSIWCGVRPREPASGACKICSGTGR